MNDIQNSEGVSRMQLFDSIRDVSKEQRRTSDKVIEIATQQKADRKRQDERWTDHNVKHDELRDQNKHMLKRLDDIKAATCSHGHVEPINVNKLMKYGFVILILFIALLFGVYGVPLPTAIPGVIP